MNYEATEEQLEAEKGLYTYFLVGAEGEQYDDFRTFWTGIVSMVAHKKFGWISAITELGYEEIMKAHKELEALGYFDDDDEDSDLFD